jgi:methanogenic corrinoid protein MtbC1
MQICIQQGKTFYMIKWCAYCRTFLAESPPYDSLKTEYGICKNCFQSAGQGEQDFLRNSRAIILFYEKIEQFSLSGNFQSAQQLFNEATKLGFRPLDLAIGVIQPLLYKVGACWARGEISIAEEHHFTSYCESLLALIRQNLLPSEEFTQTTQPEVLLINVGDNYHTIGIRLVELWLATHSIPSYTIYPGLPPSEVMNMIQFMKPRILGISVATIDQIQKAKALENQILSSKRKQLPKLIFGGYALKTNAEVHPLLKSKVINGLDELLAEVLTGDLLERAG